MSSEQQDKLKQLGNTLVQKQEYEGAAKFYDRALELDSTSEGAAAIFSNRSLCFLNTKKFNEALQDAEKAISIRPTWHRGYQRAAAACEKLEKYEEGLKHLEKCFELDEASENDETLNEMKLNFDFIVTKENAPSMSQDELKQVGNRFVQQQQHDKAIDIYTLAINKNKQQRDTTSDEAAPILSNRSLCYFNIGKYTEAYEDGQACCRIRPQWAKGFFRKGVAAQKLDEWKIALESYDEYLKLDPEDEAEVSKSRKIVVKALADQKQEEEERSRLLLRVERELASMENLEEKTARTYEELLTGAGTFDLERMKLAMSQSVKPRLDTPFLRKYIEGDTIDRGFVPQALKEAKKAFTKAPENPHVMVVCEMLLLSFAGKEFYDGIKKFPVSRQVAVLDFILDVVEEQNFSVPSRFGDRMRSQLFNICWYEPTSAKHNTIRKELVVLLFKRIDTARKFFIGGHEGGTEASSTSTNKDFATAMLSAMCSNFIGENSRLAYDKWTDVCTPAMLDCMQLALEHDADTSSIRPCRESVERSGSILDRAIMNLRSVKAIELLLRHGADVTVVTQHAQETNIGFHGHDAANHSPTTSKRSTPYNALAYAFCTYRPDIIRLLLAHGAQLPATGKLPKAVLKRFPTQQYPLVKPNYSCHLTNMTSNRVVGGAHPLLTEEYLRLLFDTVFKQDFSFLILDDPNLEISNTPLTLAVMHQLSPEVMETMIKIRPDLLTTLTDRSPVSSVVLSPPGMIIYGLCQNPNTTLEYASAVVRLFKRYGFNFKKDTAQKRAFPNGVPDNMSGVTLVEQMMRNRGITGGPLGALKKVMLE